MSEWTGKSRGGALGYKIFIFLIKYTHIRIAYFFLKFVAVYFFFFSNKTSLIFYFRKIHGYGQLKTYLSIYKNYCLLGEILIDKIALLSGVAKCFTFDFDGEENLRQIVSGGRGGLLVGAHMGNWEVAGQLLERIDTRINLVMYEAEHEQIKAILDDVLIKKNLNVIPIKDDFTHLFKLAEAFENKEIVVMHGDRFLPGTSTLFLNFMNHQAQFPTGPVYLAAKHQVPVSFVYTLKERLNHYHFFATPAKVYPYPANLKTRKQLITVMVEEYVKATEVIVKKYPTQWFNYYPFWEEEKIKS